MSSPTPDDVVVCFWYKTEDPGGGYDWGMDYVDEDGQWWGCNEDWDGCPGKRSKPPYRWWSIESLIELPLTQNEDD